LSLLSFLITSAVVVVAAGPRPAAAQRPAAPNTPAQGGSDTSDTYSVGTAAARRGTTALGALEVPAGADSALSIPVAVVHGVRPGPVVAFVAGSHPTEYSTSIALQRLIPRIDAAKLAGTVIIIPILNVPAFVSMSPQVNPPDPRTMVAGYPGDSSGTRSQRAEALLTREVIARADAVIDLHGGDFDEDVGVPFAGWVRGGRPAQDSASQRLALAFGLQHIVVYDRDATSPNAGRTLAGQALVRGKATLLAAIGRSGAVTAADITTTIDGSLNLLGALGMLDRPVRPVAHPIWLRAIRPVTAESAGVFFASTTPGTRLAKDALIGYTTDYLGRKTGDVRSPVDGLVTMIRGVPSMWPGATLAEVYPVMQELAPWQPPARRP
jgi:predicted deacylase